MTTQVAISCHCSLNSFSIPIPTSSLPLPSRICHCTSCRRSTGSLFTISVALPNATSSDFLLGTTLRASIDGEGKTTTRWFCVKCGAHMLRERASVDGLGGREWVVRVGVVKDWEKLVQIGSHIFVGDTIDGGASILLPSLRGKDLPLYSEGAGSTLFKLPPPPPRELDSSSSDISSFSPSTSSSAKPLLVQCLCKQVSLHLSRPSSSSTHLPHPSPPPSHLSSSDSSSNPWWLQILPAHPSSHFMAKSCVCTSCTINSGTPFFPWSYVPLYLLSLSSSSSTPSFAAPFDPRSLDNLQSFRTQDPSDIERFFCKGCGASVFYTQGRRAALVDLSVWLFDAEEGARAESWLEWERGTGWAEDVDGSKGEVLDGLMKGMKIVGTGEVTQKV